MAELTGQTTAAPPDQIADPTAELLGMAARLRRARAQMPDTGRTDGVAAYRWGWRDAYDQAALLLEEQAAQLATSPGRAQRAVDGAEWGARWTDGGYCPSTPARSEEFARKHARSFGTRPIRREVGPWVYADTGELAFPDDRKEDAR